MRYQLLQQQHQCDHYERTCGGGCDVLYVIIFIDIPKIASANMIDNIKKFAKNEAIEFTLHAREKMYKRGITSMDVKQSLLE